MAGGKLLGPSALTVSLRLGHFDCHSLPYARQKAGVHQAFEGGPPLVELQHPVTTRIRILWVECKIYFKTNQLDKDEKKR